MKALLVALTPAFALIGSACHRPVAVVGSIEQQPVSAGFLACLGSG